MCAVHFDSMMAVETSNGTSTFGLQGQRDLCGHGKLWDVRLAERDCSLVADDWMIGRTTEGVPAVLRKARRK